MKTREGLVAFFLVAGVLASCGGRDGESDVVVSSWRARLKRLVSEREDDAFARLYMQEIRMDIPMTLGGALPLGGWLLHRRGRMNGPSGETIDLPAEPFAFFVDDKDGVRERPPTVVDQDSHVVIGTEKFYVLVCLEDGGATRLRRKE
jgi:hypothetical protein